MARPPEITDDDIIMAGQALEAAGRPVIASKLYAAVGSRGRPDRLLAVWKTYVATRSSAQAIEPPALPPAVRDSLAQALQSMGESIERAVRHIAADLATEAAARTAAERDALSRERAALAEAEADALADFTAMADEVERLRADRLRLAEDAHRSEVARQASEAVRQLAVEQLSAAQAACTEALLDAARVGERSAAAERRITELEAALVTMQRSAADRRRPSRQSTVSDETSSPTIHGPRQASARSARRAEASRRGGRRSPAPGGEVAAEAVGSPD